MYTIVEVEELNAEETADILSVAIGFKSDVSELDVLFVMCGRVFDERARIGLKPRPVVQRLDWHAAETRGYHYVRLPL
jgi:hypothetical protein